ncbi:MAG: Fic family protein [Gammaproteobacteria bacterium]|nr:Fic family protein [Gammaproteobacteria bacterium]MBP9728960.1 Fic family protein [Gammaproteobacteria bacterium]
MQTNRYNWQHPKWPHFQYDVMVLQECLYQYALEAGVVMGSLSQLSTLFQTDAFIDHMVLEALHTSEIEGELLDPQALRSSIQRELGIVTNTTIIRDPKVLGISKLMVLARETFAEPLSKEQLFEWHVLLLSDPFVWGRIEIGTWRSGHEPMQIVSADGWGRDKVHFEAPPAARVDQEMERFIEWFNATDPNNQTGIKIAAPLRAAIAHLYFESIHPFADSNGRIGRILSEKVLSQALGRPVLLSLSTSIAKNKKDYYQALSLASRYEIDITPWIHYFINVLYQAQLEAKTQITFIVQKTKFWVHYEHRLNDRQKKVVARLFKAVITGFKGGLSAQKYMKISECSKATATRDLGDLVDQGCIVKLEEGGRNTRYTLVLDQASI